MPTYEYVCTKWGEQFVHITSFKELEAGQVTCPKCNAAEVKQQRSSFKTKPDEKDNRQLGVSPPNAQFG